MIFSGCKTFQYLLCRRTTHNFLGLSRTTLQGSGQTTVFHRLESTEYKGMELSKVVQRLHKIASPSLAGSWDNVGLLVEPSKPHKVNKILLTNDLTPPVLDEAIGKKMDLIISYHPPIFVPFKRLTQKKWKEQIIVKCIENRIAVFSPHTSHDCVEGGVNDWLISCFDTKTIKPVELHEEYPTNHTHKVSFDLPADRVSEVTGSLKNIQQASVAECSNRSESVCHMDLLCIAPSLLPVMDVVKKETGIQNLETKALAKVPKPGYGMGRKATLNSAISIDTAVTTVKKHLKLDKVRLAKAPGNPPISSVAVCAGSGGSVLRDVQTNLYVTGEMSHHEVLHAVYNGTSVILCEHSNTERGYLRVLRDRITDTMQTEAVEVVVSETDCDPLNVV